MCISSSKRVQVRSFVMVTSSTLHMNENVFSEEKHGTLIRFEDEADMNSEWSFSEQHRSQRRNGKIAGSVNLGTG